MKSFNEKYLFVNPKEYHEDSPLRHFFPENNLSDDILIFLKS